MLYGSVCMYLEGVSGRKEGWHLRKIMNGTASKHGLFAETVRKRRKRRRGRTSTTSGMLTSPPSHISCLPSTQPRSREIPSANERLQPGRPAGGPSPASKRQQSHQTTTSTTTTSHPTCIHTTIDGGRGSSPPSSVTPVGSSS